MSIDDADLRSAGAFAPAFLDALAPLDPALLDPALAAAGARFAWTSARGAPGADAARALDDERAAALVPAAEEAAAAAAEPPATLATHAVDVSAVAAARFVDAADGREVLDTRLAQPLFDTASRAAPAVHAAPAAAAGALPLITVSDAVADESSTALTFVVTLSAPATEVVSVSYNNSNVTAANGSDYTAQSGTLTFAVGETSKTVSIPVLNTAGAEPTEMMALNLFSAVNATIGRPLAYGTIFDNDAPSGTPVVRVADQVVDEASGQVSFVVTLDRPSTGTVSVDVATVNGTALAGSDYTALSTQTLTFAPGQMVKVVNVGLLNDGTAEGSETFSLKLSSSPRPPPRPPR